MEKEPIITENYIDSLNISLIDKIDSNEFALSKKFEGSIILTINNNFMRPGLMRDMYVFQQKTGKPKSVRIPDPLYTFIR